MYHFDVRRLGHFSFIWEPSLVALEKGSGHAPVILRRLFSSVQDHTADNVFSISFHLRVRRQQREDSMESLSVCSLIMVCFSDVGAHPGL